ncbi:phosphoribosylformylglycinamidine synthase subunit PurS [Companilactobacillus mishanensis]|uniref:Phosphoribosylformylglycinamidine synthase subunit PurS n=1 Tax=Companilactobacillus mishanensis TaxID=2486008 RepID=A0A5P0ZEM0_9LACO|nr:phosphoribosylformylglycinamidine synthase subunit PurS [Companilactobacillus mishanensis]MQS44400.1 phosphoribosylformylglycinamidine synthase subunit PurS [Companilactobacillus mishanensis]MQS51496.1 phosphoribosylformylglycinamidine synthase subunit PurS [Companilactobacillus mishanensis]MQS88643.1 phosphoribosylformylglycinamidine synthase subunit PurS [Companilactobacillus mishanensis]
MTLVKVYVTYKESILDPQGEAIETAIHGMGHNDINGVRMGKYFEINFTDDAKDIDTEIDTICDKLLANPNMETYRYEIVNAEGAK